MKAAVGPRWTPDPRTASGREASPSMRRVKSSSWRRGVGGPADGTGRCPVKQHGWPRRRAETDLDLQNTPKIALAAAPLSRGASLCQCFCKDKTIPSSRLRPPDDLLPGQGCLRSTPSALCCARFHRWPARGAGQLSDGHARKGLAEEVGKLSAAGLDPGYRLRLRRHKTERRGVENDRRRSLLAGRGRRLRLG